MLHGVSGWTVVLGAVDRDISGLHTALVSASVGAIWDEVLADIDLFAQLVGSENGLFLARIISGDIDLTRVAGWGRCVGRIATTG